MITGQENQHSRDVIAYAKACLAKDANECKWVKLAAVRFLRDLKKSPYDWNQDKVNKICSFIEQMQHVKGRKWMGQKIKLELWQKFQLGNVFGFINPDTGLRRFKISYEEVPRKNAKSTKAAAVSNYMLAADGEYGGENYTAATRHEQASIVFNIAHAMAEKNADFREHYGVDVGKYVVSVPDTGSTLTALSSDYSGMDGLNISYVCVDELHAHKTRKLYDVLETGTGAREQSLIFIETTAGSNRAGICYEQRTYTTKILTGVVVDDNYWGIIYTIDDDDDWRDPKTWMKANPNYDISVLPDVIEGLARKAMALPSAQNNFLTKHLNVWVNADTAWLDIQALVKCIDVELTMEEFEDFECIDTLDIASKTDFSSRARIFWEEDEDELLHIYCFMKRWLPEQTIETADNDQYEGWAADGWIEKVDGAIIDVDEIVASELEDNKIYDIREVAYDPWQASYLAKKMSNEGIEMVEYRQTVQNMSEPMKELGALIIDQRFHFDGDPALVWMFSNVVCHVDAKENIYPRKELEANKIDDVVAIIMGVGRLLVRDEVQESIYRTRGIRTL